MPYTMGHLKSKILWSFCTKFMGFSHTYMCIHTSTPVSKYIHTHTRTNVQASLSHIANSNCLVCFAGNYPIRFIFYAVFMTTYSSETLVYIE
jgi:hypothetical protein